MKINIIRIARIMNQCKKNYSMFKNKPIAKYLFINNVSLNHNRAISKNIHFLGREVGGGVELQLL